MTRIYLIVIAFLGMGHFATAQFDDRFYFPSKEYHLEESLSYEDLFFDIDTVKIHALVLKPEQQAKTTILFFIGAGGNASYYTPIAKPLVSAGYQVVMFEPRGYGLSTGVPKHLNVISDAQIVLDKLLERESIKNTDIVVYGASLGSQAACHITKNNPDKISALILDGAMSSFTDMALVNTPEEQKQTVKQYVTSPYSAKEDVKDLANTPKLFIHSKEDETVPFSQGELNYNNALEPKVMWVHPGGHLQAAKVDEMEFIQKINEFISTVQ